MESLHTLAMIYETGKEPVLKGVLDKLMFDNHCFVFLRIDPKQDGSYTYSDGEMYKLMKKKLDAADELYIINPKGSIARYLHYFLGYSEETGKPIRYMYKFCYKDCRHRKGNACTQPMEIYFTPDSHKLLPACENYVRIYDDYLVSSKSSVPNLDQANFTAVIEDEPAPELTPEVVVEPEATAEPEAATDEKEEAAASAKK